MSHTIEKVYQEAALMFHDGEPAAGVRTGYREDPTTNQRFEFVEVVYNSGLGKETAEFSTIEEALGFIESLFPADGKGGAA